MRYGPIFCVVTAGNKSRLDAAGQHLVSLGEIHPTEGGDDKLATKLGPVSQRLLDGNGVG
jgi:hypothetical protein